MQSETAKYWYHVILGSKLLGLHGTKLKNVGTM